ncbi:unnamed protein product [Trichobilharzia szidati]|nr:unnamed protein product [Trichobilharzia szidati]
MIKQKSQRPTSALSLSLPFSPSPAETTSKEKISKPQTTSICSHNITCDHPITGELEKSPWIKYYRNMCAQLTTGFEKADREDLSKSCQNLNKLKYLTFPSQVTNTSNETLINLSSGNHQKSMHNVGNKFVSFLRGAFHRKNSNESICTRNRKLDEYADENKHSRRTSSTNCLYDSATQNVDKLSILKKRNCSASSKVNLKRLLEVKHCDSQINDEMKNVNKSLMSESVSKTFDPSINLSNHSVHFQNSPIIKSRSALNRPSNSLSPSKDKTVKRTRFSLHPSTCNAPSDLMKPRNSDEQISHEKSLVKEDSEKLYRKCNHSKELQNINEKLLNLDEKHNETAKETIQHRNQGDQMKELHSLSSDTDLNTMTEKKDESKYDRVSHSAHSVSKDQIIKMRKFHKIKSRSLTFLTPGTYCDKSLPNGKLFDITNSLCSLSESSSNTAITTKAEGSGSINYGSTGSSIQSLSKFLTIHPQKLTLINVAEWENRNDKSTPISRSCATIQGSTTFESACRQEELMIDNKSQGKRPSARCFRRNRTRSECASSLSLNRKVHSKRLNKHYPHKLRNYSSLIHSLGRIYSNYYKTTSLAENENYAAVEKTSERPLTNTRRFRGDGDDYDDKSSDLSQLQSRNSIANNIVYKNKRLNNKTEVKPNTECSSDQQLVTDGVGTNENLRNFTSCKQSKENSQDDLLDTVPTKECTSSTLSSLSQPSCLSAINSCKQLFNLEQNLSESTSKQQTLKGQSDKQNEISPTEKLYTTKFENRKTTDEKQLTLTSKLDNEKHLIKTNSKSTVNENVNSAVEAPVIEQAQNQKHDQIIKSSETIQISEKNVYLCSPSSCHENDRFHQIFKTPSPNSKEFLPQDKTGIKCMQTTSGNCKNEADDELSFLSMTGTMATTTTPSSLWHQLHYPTHGVDSLVDQKMAEDCQNEQGKKYTRKSVESHPQDKTETVSSVSPCTLINTRHIFDNNNITSVNINGTSDSVNDFVSNQPLGNLCTSGVQYPKQVSYQTTSDVCLQTEYSPSIHKCVYSCPQNFSPDGMQPALHPVIHYVAPHPLVYCVPYDHYDSLCGCTNRCVSEMSSHAKSPNSVQKCVQTDLLIESLSENTEPLNDNISFNIWNENLIKARKLPTNQSLQSEVINQFRESDHSQYVGEVANRSQTTLPNTRVENQFTNEFNGTNSRQDSISNECGRRLLCVMHHVNDCEQGDNKMTGMSKCFENSIPSSRYLSKRSKTPAWKDQKRNYDLGYRQNPSDIHHFNKHMQLNDEDVSTSDLSEVTTRKYPTYALENSASSYCSCRRRKFDIKRKGISDWHTQHQVQKRRENILSSRGSQLSLVNASPIRPGLRLSKEYEKQHNNRFTLNESLEKNDGYDKLSYSSQVREEFDEMNTLNRRRSYSKSKNVSFENYTRTSSSLRESIHDDIKDTEPSGAAKQKAKQRRFLIGKHFMEVLHSKNILQSNDHSSRPQIRDGQCVNVSGSISSSIRNKSEKLSKPTPVVTKQTLLADGKLKPDDKYKDTRRPPTYTRKTIRPENHFLRHTFASLQKVRRKPEQNMFISRPPMVFK